MFTMTAATFLRGGTFRRYTSIVYDLHHPRDGLSVLLQVASSGVSSLISFVKRDASLLRPLVLTAALPLRSIFFLFSQNALILGHFQRI